jgi:hypothetical protein
MLPASLNHLCYIATNYFLQLRFSHSEKFGITVARRGGMYQ